MYLVTTAQMQRAEALANQRGVSYDTMMENAGSAVVAAMDEQFGVSGVRALVLVGPGNNGGDGLVVARRLSDLGATVTLFIWNRKNLADDLNWQRLAEYNIARHFWDDDPSGQTLTGLIDDSAFVVDALLGTGVSRPIQGSLADVLLTAREAIDNRRVADLPRMVDPLEPMAPDEIGPVIVAVDLPSGLHTDTGALDPLTLPADMTVTFAAPKWGHIRTPGAAYVGHLLIADIDIPLDAYDPALPQLATPAEMAALLPERSLFGHKGTFGKALLVAGSQNYTGAPALAGTAAYRVGAGLVTVALPAEAQPMVAPALTEATYLPLPANAEARLAMIAEARPDYQAMLVGPGLGQAAETVRFVDMLFAQRQSTVPQLVVDADALNILARNPDWPSRLPAETILTPHLGELSRLSGKSIAALAQNRDDVVPQLAQKWGHMLVCKGAFTMVAAPDGRVMVLPFANPALATAGSGDVLAGAIVGLLAQGLDPFEAAVLAGYLHGLAGDRAREKFWEAGVLAGDLPAELPGAMRELLLG